MKVTATSLTSALRELSKRGQPTQGVAAFLKAHYESDGQVATMTNLAKAAKYKNFGGVNAQYGRLANSIAKILEIKAPNTRTFLLAEFVPPRTQSNAHYQLVMRKEFAQALKTAGWV